MKNSILFLVITTIISAAVNAQDFYRVTEAVKNPAVVEALVIFPDKDDMMRFATSADRFKNLHTIKISGTCDTLKMQSVTRAISRIPALKTLIIEKTDLEIYPASPVLTTTIEKIELYENDQLDYADFITKAKSTSVATLVMDVYELSELPGNLSLLKNLTTLKVYDKNSVLFDTHKKYESDDTEVMRSNYIFSGESKTISFSFSSAEIIPGKNDLDRIKNSTGTDKVSEVISATFEKKYEHIIPPVEGLNIRKETFTLNTADKKTITSTTGTVIRIPGNAFVDKNGNPVSGNIEIGYREFRDQLDILVSGIPMVFDSAGTKKQFESAGMFEITASINGEEVFLATDKKINMEFNSQNPANNFNLYYYDDAKGNWEPEPGLQPTVSKSKTTYRKVRMSNAMTKFTEMMTAKKGVRYDTTRFESRFDNTTYTYLFAKKCTTKTMPVENHKYCSIHKLIKIVSAGKGKNGEEYFSVQNYFATHPELSFLRDVKLVLDGNEKEFRKSVNGKYFCDARIKGEENNFELILKNKNGFISIPFHMVKLDVHGNIIENSPAPKIVLSRYNRKVKARTKIYNRRIKRHTNVMDGYEVTSKEEILLAAYENAKVLMNAKEKKMSLQQFSRVADSTFSNNLLAGMNNPTTATYITRRDLIIARMGNHNLDRSVEIAEPVKIIVKMNTEEEAGKKKGIRLKTVYAMDKESNTVYNYPGNGSVTLDKAKQYLLLGVTEEGKLAWPENNSVNAQELSKGENIVLQARLIEKTGETLEDMKQMLGLP
jgi:hypothetical protein